jgi:hypothetical protein
MVGSYNTNTYIHTNITINIMHTNITINIIHTNITINIIHTNITINIIQVINLEEEQGSYFMFKK